MKLKSFIPKDYPYMNARVRAKGAKLLARSDYENLLKMEPNEIAKNLEEGEYQDEINELGSMLDGAPLVETALQLSAARTISDLIEMSPESLRDIIKVFARRYDIQSIKRLLRWKKIGDSEDMPVRILPSYHFSKERLEELAEMDIEEIIESIKFDGLVDYSDYLSGDMSISDLEKALDQAYFDELEKVASSTRSKEFREFIDQELEYENLRIAIRLKNYDVEPEKIREKTFDGENSDLVQKVIEAEDMNEVHSLLQDSGWKVKNGSVEELEHSLEVTRLENAKKILRSGPLGVLPIIAYIVAKMIEVKNLRTLTQAKSTEYIDNDEIRERLVITDER